MRPNKESAILDQMISDAYNRLQEYDHNDTRFRAVLSGYILEAHCRGQRTVRRKMRHQLRTVQGHLRHTERILRGMYVVYTSQIREGKAVKASELDSPAKE